MKGVTLAEFIYVKKGNGLLTYLNFREKPIFLISLPKQRENKKGSHLSMTSLLHKIRGAEGTRTPVQTYPPKAFYMFI